MNTVLRLFVYGTLKRGGRHHASYCSSALDIRDGYTQGRLEDLAAGYPTLHIPPRNILALGTTHYDDDAWRGTHCIPPGEHTRAAFIAPPAPFGLVRGEVMDFENARSLLERLDPLEEYAPYGISLYLRVLLPVLVDGVILPCWTYVAPTYRDYKV